MTIFELSLHRNGRKHPVWRWRFVICVLSYKLIVVQGGWNKGLRWWTEKPWIERADEGVV